MSGAEIERWRRIREIFDEAAEAPDPAVVVGLRCSGDAALGQAVCGLLELRAKSGLALDHPPLPEPPRPVAEVLSGRFRLMRWIASGGMGEVWEAVDLHTGAPVALKFILPSLLADPRSAARFSREVQLARKIDHPNVCRIDGLFDHGGAQFCAMEFLEGETLDVRIARGRLQLEETRRIASQVCDGLHAAHSAGVIHRDLKPGNLFLCPGGAVKIIDFGLATAVEHQASLTASGALIGTLAYMAPEQLEGNAGTPASDIYSLGVVIYEMLTGSKPHRASSPFRLAALKARASHSSAEFAALPPAWREAVTRCLQPAPGKRYQSAALLKTALERSRPSLRFRLMRPAVAFPAAALLAAGLAWGTWDWWRRDDLPRPEAAPLFEQGRAALTENSPARAASLLERALAADPDYSPARALLATAYTEMDQPDRAREAVLEANTRADRRWRRGHRDRLLLDAARAAATRDFPTAAARYQQLAGVSTGQARTFALLEAARMLEQQPTRLAAARSTLEQALAEAPGSTGALVRKGLLLVRLRDYSAALKSYAEAETAFRRGGNQEGLAEVLLARSMMPGRTPEQDRRDIDEVLALSAATANRYHALTARFRLASVAFRSRDYKRGGDIARQAANDALREGMPVLAARALGDFGYSFAYLKRMDEALPWLEQSVDIALRARAPATLASNRMRLGEVLGSLRRSADAVKVMEPAIDWYRSNHYPEQLPLFLIKWGTVLNTTERWGDSIRAFEDALALAQANQNQMYESMALQRLAAAFSAADYRRSLAYWERTVQLAPRGSLTGSFFQAARAAAASGDFARAAQLIAEGDRELAAYPPGHDRTHLGEYSAESKAQVGYIRGDCAAARKTTDVYLTLCGASPAAARRIAAELEGRFEKASPDDNYSRGTLAAKAGEAALVASDSARARRLATLGLQASIVPHWRESALRNALVLRAAEAALGNPGAAARFTAVVLEHAAGLGFHPPDRFGERADLTSLWARGSVISKLPPSQR